MSTMSIKSLSLPTNFPFQSPNNTSSSLQFHPNLTFPHKPPPFLAPQTPHFPRNHHLPRCQNTPSQQPQPPQEQHEAKIRDTQEAISYFLQELGVSLEDSNTIALNSPKFARMLVDGVRDLEEWSAWKRSGDGSGGGGGDGGKGFGELGFKEKVIYMAKEKGDDNGKAAFLESLGLSLSSAMNIARYLSQDSLSGLIHKVKYMKEMFFSDSDDKRLIGKNARRMMMHLSIPVDEDLQQTLSFFEKMEARRGGLDMLGTSDASFRYLVESFPHILLLSIESQLKPMVELLESIGVPKKRMGHIILLFPPIMICDIKGMERRLHAIEKVGAADKDEDIGKMLLKYPWILSTDIQNNYKEILSFFEMEKVAKASVNKAIRSWPHLLGCSTSKMKVMVEQFGEMGVTNKKLAQVIATSPQLLLRKRQEFLEVVSFLEHLGFDQETAGKILGRCPEIFAASIEKTMKKKVEFLASLGVSKDHLPRVIKKYPELLVSDIDRTLLPRMKYLMEVGLSKKDITFMIRRFSPLLGYSIDGVLRPKYEFLVNTMEKPVTEVVDYPRYFSYSLEKKIRPRFRVLKGWNVECSLKDMLDKNDEEFAAKFMDASTGGADFPHLSSHQ